MFSFFFNINNKRNNNIHRFTFLRFSTKITVHSLKKIISVCPSGFVTHKELRDKITSLNLNCSPSNLSIFLQIFPAKKRRILIAKKRTRVYYGVSFSLEKQEEGFESLEKAKITVHSLKKIISVCPSGFVTHKELRDKITSLNLNCSPSNLSIFLQIFPAKKRRILIAKKRTRVYYGVSLSLEKQVTF